MEKRRRGQHFPLTIDSLGGVLRTSGEGGNREINFGLQGNGGLSLTREINGADWRISSGEGRGRMDIQASEDSLTVSCLTPFMVLEYSRAGGTLTDVLISGVDLAALAGTKMALERGDWANLTDLKQFQEDRLFGLRLGPEGAQLMTVDTSGREIVSALPVAGQDLGANDFGFLPGRRQYFWTDDLGFLKGRVGFEVWAGRVVLFYEKGEAEAMVRQDVMEVPRTVLGTAKLDWRVTQGMPSEDDLLEFMEEVYLPLL